MGIKSTPSRNNKRLNLNSEINVTPFVDVILVLLIIFMITSPMLITGVNVDLPQAEANKLAESEEPITITIAAGNNLYLQDVLINPKDLLSKLKSVTKENQNLTIYIRADQKILYGKMMEIMSNINKAGYSKIGLITNSQK